MKRTPLLHAGLSQVIAALGHGDRLLIGDAGTPVLAGPRRIHLALTADIPSVANVLKTVLQEMQVERALIANEAVVRTGDSRRTPTTYWWQGSSFRAQNFFFATRPFGSPSRALRMKRLSTEVTPTMRASCRLMLT